MTFRPGAVSPWYHCTPITAEFFTPFLFSETFGGILYTEECGTILGNAPTLFSLASGIGGSERQRVLALANFANDASIFRNFGKNSRFSKTPTEIIDRMLLGYLLTSSKSDSPAFDGPSLLRVARAIDRIALQSRRIKGLDAIMAVGAAAMLGLIPPLRSSIPLSEITLDRERGAASMTLPSEVWRRILEGLIKFHVLPAHGKGGRALKGTSSPNENLGIENGRPWMRYDAGEGLSKYQLTVDHDAESVRLSAEALVGTVERFDVERVNGTLLGLVYFWRRR